MYDMRKAFRDVDISARLKQFRHETGLTQDEFAQKLGVHPKQLAKYEGGHSFPSVGILKKYAQAAETTVDYIIFGEDKNLSKRTKLSDLELLDLFRQVDKLKRSDREKVKWMLQQILNGEALISGVAESSSKLVKSA